MDANIGKKRRNQYVIRKFNIGTASVLMGTVMLLAIAQDAKAEETNTIETENVNTKESNSSTEEDETTLTPSSETDVLLDEQETNTEIDQNSTTENVEVQEPLETTEQPLTTETKEEVTKTESNRSSVENEPSSTTNHSPETVSDTPQQDMPTTNTADTQSTPQSTNNVFRAAADSKVNVDQPAPQANTKEIQVDGIDETVYQKGIPVLASSPKAQTLGMGRGLGQARESLGIILPKDETLYIRQSGTQNEADLSVSLMTNDGNFNKSAVIPKSGEWTAISTGIDSAAFVYLPKGLNNIPLVDFYVKNNMLQALPTYRRGENQESFETQWVDQDASYAFVDGDYNSFLIPRVDRDRVLNMKHQEGANAFHNLDEMIDYYDYVVTQYNEWAGLTDDPESVNFNVGQKYFTVANINGFGLAYWSWDHMGSNDASMYGYLSKGWLSLHEIGHGFDGWLADDPKMPLLEVWNNIFANEYQMNVENSEAGWLYEGNQEGFQQRFQENILDATPYTDFNQYSAREKLDFMTRMVRLTGIEGMTDMLQNIRQEVATTSSSRDMPRWIGDYWLAERGYNALAYFDLFAIDTPQYLEDRLNAYSNSYIYPLAMLIEDEAEAQKYVEQLGLATKYELVRSKDIADTTIQSDATVNLALNNHILPEGATVSLIDGTATVATAVVKDGKAQFDGIRPGIFQIKAPVSQQLALPDHTYMIVRENHDNEATLVYPKIEETQTALSQKISLLGLSNREFTTVAYTPNTKEVILRQNSGQPHFYFTDEYAHVTIQKQDGTVVFDESIVGNDNIAALDETYHLEYGDKVIIKHREPDRRQVKRMENNTIMALPDATMQTVTYTLTDKGFAINDETEQDVTSRYTDVIQQDIDTFIDTVEANPDKNYRTVLYRLVQSVEKIEGADDREALLKQLEPYLEQSTITPLTVQPIEYDHQIIQGQSSYGASITVTLPSNATLTTEADEMGNWSLQLSPSQQLNWQDQVEVIAVKDGEVRSNVVNAEVIDTVRPDEPTLVAPQAGSKIVQGTAMPNVQVVVQFKNGSKVTTQAQEDGKWSISVPEDVTLAYNDQIVVEAIDQAGNTSNRAIKTVIDTIRPKRPTVTLIEAGSHIIWGTGETYKDEILVRLPNNEVVRTKVGRNGTWMIGVPFNVTLNAGDSVLVSEIDQAGNYSLAGVGSVVDTTAPKVPTVDEITTESEWITGQAEPKNQVRVVLADGTVLTGFANEAGDYQINVPQEGLLQPDTSVTVTATDAYNNTSAEVQQPIQNVEPSVPEEAPEVEAEPEPPVEDETPQPPVDEEGSEVETMPEDPSPEEGTPEVDEAPPEEDKTPQPPVKEEEPEEETPSDDEEQSEAEVPRVDDTPEEDTSGIDEVLPEEEDTSDDEAPQVDDATPSVEEETSEAEETLENDTTEAEEPASPEKEMMDDDQDLPLQEDISKEENRLPAEGQSMPSVKDETVEPNVLDLEQDQRTTQHLPLTDKTCFVKDNASIVNVDTNMSQSGQVKQAVPKTVSSEANLTNDGTSAPALLEHAATHNDASQSEALPETGTSPQRTPLLGWVATLLGFGMLARFRKQKRSYKTEE